MAVGIAAAQLNAWLNAYARNVAYTQPAAFWVKLHLGDPGAAGTANAAANTSRQQATFAAASGGAVATSADLTWVSVSATETYSHVSFWTAATAGTFLGSDDLAAAKSVTAGDTFTIAAGQLTIAITPVAA
jgi:hypothetical protein